MFVEFAEPFDGKGQSSQTDAGIDGPVKTNVEQADQKAVLPGHGQVKGDQVGGVFDETTQTAAQQVAKQVLEKALPGSAEQRGIVKTI